MKPGRVGEHASNTRKAGIRPEDIELMPPETGRPFLSGKKHVERHPSGILKYGLTILGSGIGLALWPLYLFSKDFGIANTVKRQDLTGIYLLAAYLLLIALVSLWRFGKRKRRDWMEKD